MKVVPQQAAGLGCTLTILVWLGGFHLNTLLVLAALLYLPHPAAVSVLMGLLALALLPLDRPGRPSTAWQERLAKHISAVAHSYFPVTMHVHPETRAGFARKGQKFVIGLEPHSVLPVSVIAFHPGAPGLPVELESREKAALASSAIFRVPFVKNLWSWLGLQSVDRRNMRRLLEEDHSVLLIPGGAQECLYMEQGKETIFLRKRFGFVKLAIQSGAHLVPAFAFGQSSIFCYWKPGPPLLPAAVPRLLTRMLGFSPMLFWGRWGTPIPYRVPVHVVVGEPLTVKQDPNPSDDAVAAMLGAFINAMEDLFEQHKAAAGYAGHTLVVL